MNKKLLIIPALILAIGITTLGISTKVSAATFGNRGIFGTVTAINGDIITMQHTTHTKGSTTITSSTYTVDATNAIITKNNAESAITDIAINDKIHVKGTVNGSAITATKIVDGVTTRHHVPGIHGTVTAVNGDTLTVQTAARTKGTTTKPAVTYTVNASAATVTKNKVASTISAITVGDISGTTVTATKIHDGIIPKTIK